MGDLIKGNRWISWLFYDFKLEISDVASLFASWLGFQANFLKLNKVVFKNLILFLKFCLEFKCVFKGAKLTKSCVATSNIFKNKNGYLGLNEELEEMDGFFQ